MNYQIEKPWIHIQIDETFHNQTILQFLEYYKQSKKNRYLLIQNKHLLLNHQEASLSVKLKRNDILSLAVFQPIKSKIALDSTPLSIAYEDDFVLLVNKDTNLLVHSDGTGENTLCNRVQGYFENTKQCCQVHPIHRLDKETTGLVLFCKCAFFQPYFDDLLQQKKIHREYKAIVEGILPLHTDIKIEQPIARDRHNAKKQRISKNGKDACTIIRCVQHKHGNSLINCTLMSGRTHQIRVHMAYLKHPILSDPLYGHRFSNMPRLALHAYQISWIHPITKEQIHIKISFPLDFIQYMK